MVMLVDVALLVGVAPGDGVCVLMAAEECWTVAIGLADRVEVGGGVDVRVALGQGVAVDVPVALGQGVAVDVLVTVGGGVLVSVSSNTT
jgi:hypothetical protein